MSDAHRPPHRVEPTRSPAAGRVWLLLCLSVAPWPRASEAQVHAPIPEPTGERVYVIGVVDEYGPLRDEIARLERTSPQTYYVVVLRSAGPGRRAARDYLEALVGRWEDRARQGRSKFDGRRSVIIVVDVENKRIIVSGGEELQERYGFRDPYIERDLLSQHFYPYARAGDYARGMRVLVAQIDRWIAARDQAAAATGDHRSRSRAVPALILGALLAATLAALGGLWHRRRRARGALDARFQGFRQQAVALMDRLDALRQRHRRLAAGDSDDSVPMTGSTLAMFRQVEADLNALWERWLRVMEAWDRAQALARKATTFGTRDLEQARKLLEQEGDFEEITGRVEPCRERLDRLDRGHERAREALEAAGDESARLREALDEIRAADLPDAPYLKELGAVDTLMSQAGSLARADPIGTVDVVTKARAALSALAGRADQVLARSRQATEARQAIDGVARRASELRSQGLKLTEGPADPDPRLDRARRLVAAALEALRQADPDAAGRPLDRARAAADRAGAGIDRHLRAREALARDLPALHEASTRLEQAARQAAGRIEDLRARFAPSSWGAVADNLDRARARLDAARARIERADRLGSEAVQRYLRAAAARSEAADQHARAEPLLRGLSERHEALVALARQVQEQFRALEGEVGRAAGDLERDREVIGPEARRSFEAAGRAARELAGAIADPRPDWPEARARLDAVRRGLALARKQAQEDVEGYRRTVERLEQVRRRAQGVGALLAREQKDRPPANQRFRAAAQALAGFGRDARIDPGSWDRELRRLDEIAADLDRAEALADRDIAAANGAIAEIARAARAIREAHAFYDEGVVVDVSEAEGQLDRARASLASRAYEQAIERANRAERLAREARDQAASEARRRRMSAERGQVFDVLGVMLIAAAQVAAEAAGRWAAATEPAAAPAPPPGGEPDPTGGSRGIDAPSESRAGGADRGSW